MTSRPIVFIDTETTSLRHDREPWEIAIIRREPSGDDVEHLFQVEIDESHADLISLNIGGYFDRYADKPMHRHQAATAVADLTRDAVIVGACPNFDTETLAPMLRAHGRLPAWHYQLVDVENLASGYLAARGEIWNPPCNSNDLSRAVGIEPPGKGQRHTAMGDARWCRDLYDAIMADDPIAQVRETHQPIPEHLIREIVELAEWSDLEAAASIGRQLAAINKNWSNR